MKNAGKHADDLKALFKRLQREGKPEQKKPLDPLRAIVRGAMSYDVSDVRADEAMKAIEKEFVDLNELRVATELEIQEMLGVKYPAIAERVTLMTQSLNRIFEREHTLSLERLRTISKRDARQFIRDLPSMNPFVEAFIMLMSFDGHAVPVDQHLVEYLVSHGVVEEGASIDDAQKFLEHHLKADECHDFHVLSRRAAIPVEAGETEPKRKKR